MQRDNLQKDALLSVMVNNVTTEETISMIDDLIRTKRKSSIVEVNVDVVMKAEKNAALRNAINDSTLSLVDGMPLVWISKLYHHPIREKISGSDLVPLLCQRAVEKGHTIFMLGGMPDVLAKAKANLEDKFPGIQIVGIYSPPFGFEDSEQETDKIIDAINAAQPDLLITCFGCPKQELFIANNMARYDATVSLCAGGTIDFLAGNIQRAPKWMSDHGLEWFYRFTREPKRLFKRYFIDDTKVIALVVKYRKQARKRT